MPSREISPIGLVAACWGNYWYKFGADYIRMISELEPAPHSLVVVSDSESWLVQPKSNVPMWDWLNQAVETSIAEWICFAGIDDLYFPDALKDIRLPKDVLAIAGVHDGRHFGVDGDWDTMLQKDYNVICGGAVFRRTTFLRFPWRRLPGADWVQYMEMRAAGIELEICERKRFIHRVHPLAISSNGRNHLSDRMANSVRKLLLAGQPIPDKIPLRLSPRMLGRV